MTFATSPSKMTPKQRLLAPFRGIKPDRPAWLADLSYWYDAMAHTGKLPSQYRSEGGYRRLHEDLGVCIYYNYGFHPCLQTTLGGAATCASQTSGNHRTNRWRSPAGELHDAWQYLEESLCWAHVEYAVKTVDDLAVVADIFANRRYRPAYENYIQAVAAIGENGLPITAAPRSPLPALLADWCGVESTIMMLMDTPDPVVEILAGIDRANDAAFDLLCDSPCELIHFCDNLDSSSSTPFFADHMQGYYEKRLRQLHQAGKYAVVHLDGRVRGLLPKLAACGFDGVESITPAPVGDVAIEELRAVAANSKTILWGGIPGAMFCSPWSAGDIGRHTTLLLDTLASDGRLVVGSADQIPPDGCLDYCKIIAETIEGWTDHI